MQVAGGCCEPPPTPGNPCKEEPKVVGPCEALIPSWSFVEESGKCEFFSYGGCEGTANRFDSEEDCNETCDVAPGPCICTKEYAPVCDPATGTTYGNACEAACDDLAPEDLVDGECEVRRSRPLARPIARALHYAGQRQRHCTAPAGFSCLSYNERCE